MSVPHLCPVCLGHGNVSGGFYNCVPGGTPTSCNTSEICRACNGGGVIYNGELQAMGSMTLTTSNYDPITKTELIKELKKIENTLKEILGAIKLQGKSV